MEGELIQCSECSLLKDRSNYRLERHRYLRKQCNTCRQEADYRRRIKRVFGLDYEQVKHLIYGDCQICGQPETKEHTDKLSLDHDHYTGKFRGYLCHDCNTGLGKFKDDPEILTRAATYLLENWRNG